MSKIFKSPVSALLVLCLILSLASSAFADEVHLCAPVKTQLLVDGESRIVQCVASGEENNLYVSLCSLAAALSGSAKQFSYTYLSDYFGAPAYIVRTGEPYSGADGALESEESVYLSLKRYRIYADDTERKYYAYDYGEHDVFLSLPDVQFMLNAKFTSSGGSLTVNTESPFVPDLPAAADGGVLESIRALVVGDLDTGEIIFSLNPDESLAIASLSKLMTYVVLRDALGGTPDPAAVVPLSENVIALSKSENGMLPLKSGDSLTVGEILCGMLVPSSNECALAAAELAAGTEEKCVDKMNLWAKKLGLSSAVFLNSHGLPVYSDPVFPAKLQNMMSAADLFELVSYIQKTYPEITEITSRQYIRLDSIDYSLANSNPLVFNMPGVTGLKTGTTDRAGYSLVATMPVTSRDGSRHTVAVVELGAEIQSDRGRISELALRWAEEYFAANGFARSGLGGLFGGSGR